MVGRNANAPDAILTPTDSVSEGFGTSVAVNTNLILVGDPLAFNGKHSNGAAFAYKKPASGWVNATQSDRLQVSGQLVGYSVAAQNNGKAFLGAPRTTIDGKNWAGAVFLVAIK